MSQYIFQRYHFVEELQARGKIEITYMRKDSMKTNILNKPLSENNITDVSGDQVYQEHR